MSCQNFSSHTLFLKHSLRSVVIIKKKKKKGQERKEKKKTLGLGTNSPA